MCLMYVLTVFVNWVLINMFTELGIGDVLFWVWGFIPTVCYIVGREID